jgi:hypothetical protein
MSQAGSSGYHDSPRNELVCPFIVRCDGTAQLGFTMALCDSSSLHTLIDTSTVHNHSGPHSEPLSILAKSNIESLMQSVPKFRTIKSNSRIWTVRSPSSYAKTELKYAVIGYWDEQKLESRSTLLVYVTDLRDLIAFV